MDSKSQPRPDGLTQGELERIQAFEEAVKKWQEKALEKAPERVKTLGPILRKSVRTGSISALVRFCKKHEIDVKRRDMESFRDWLITQRFDMKDLEPAARERLRFKTLRGQPKEEMSQSYAAGIRKGEKLKCRDCIWFVKAPLDGDKNDPDSNKACVEFGTKGSDDACYGFTRPN